MQTKQQNIVGIFRRVDGLTVLLYAILVFMGWFNIYAAVLNENSTGIFDVSFKYGKQLIWMIAAFLIALSIIIIDSRFYSVLAYPVYGFVLVLLAIVIFMPQTKGQSSWFELGDFKIQPAEFAKISVALVLSKYLSGYNVKVTNLNQAIKIAAIIGVPVIFILLQPDVGTALVFGAFLFVLFREGMPAWVLIAVFCAVILFIASFIFGSLIVSFVVLAIIYAFIIIAYVYHKQTNVLIYILPPIACSLPWILVYLFDIEIGEYILFAVSFFVLFVPLVLYSYRKRIASFLILFSIAFASVSFSYSVDYIFHSVLEKHHRTRINVLFGLESDPQGVEFNVIQSKIAIGSGGLHGKGYLQGTQTKHDFVPEQSTDFIFCTVGEEWGFIGVFVVVSLFLMLLLRILFLAERQRSVLSRVYGYSVATILFMHLLINVGMTIGLMPVIGIPLPFFSYGGSSLWAFTILLFIFIKFDTDRDILVF
jgi:rod shape determining protein RodA